MQRAKGVGTSSEKIESVPAETGPLKIRDEEYGMRTILRLSGGRTCSANEALTIKRAASSAVGPFPARRPDAEDVDDLDADPTRCVRAPDRSVEAVCKEGGEKGRERGRESRKRA